MKKAGIALHLFIAGEALLFVGVCMDSGLAPALIICGGVCLFAALMAPMFPG